MDDTKRGRGRPKKIVLGPGQEFPAGMDMSDDLPNEIVSVDMSDQRMEKMARGYFVGQHAIGRKKDIRQVLEKKVTDKIGKEGKMLVGKLFELIEGVYVVDRLKSVHGKEEVRYYKVPPSLPAIIYALDRVLGKPVQKSMQASVSFSLKDLLSNGPKREE